MDRTATIVETPRDAFQGLPKFIPTDQKIQYIQSLLAAGLKHLDVGSFVSPKAVPQMTDSEEVFRAVRGDPQVEFLALVVNPKGVDRALEVGGLQTLGFPFSFSDEFQRRNTRKLIAETWPILREIKSRTEEDGMSFLVYLSMAFGNPYGDPWSEDALLAMLKQLRDDGILRVALSDTTGQAEAEQLNRIFRRAQREIPEAHLSVHLHGRPAGWQAVAQAALNAGCRQFDGAAGGLGGCPFAQDHLVGNLPTEGLVTWLSGQGYETGVDAAKLAACAALARRFQTQYGCA